jgi:hypothetical protein
VVLWDLQQAAKDKSRRGLEILEQCMEDTTCDWNTRLKAVELLFERAYGRPQVSVDMNMTHNFAEVPETMPLGLWLERKGQPVGASGDEWLRQQGAGGGGTSDAPSSQAGHSSGPPTIDLKAEPEPEDELPPARAKLN